MVMRNGGATISKTGGVVCEMESCIEIAIVGCAIDGCTWGDIVAPEVCCPCAVLILAFSGESSVWPSLVPCCVCGHAFVRDVIIYNICALFCAQVNILIPFYVMLTI